jgi:hypothetical protein
MICRSNDILAWENTWKMNNFDQISEDSLAAPQPVHCNPSPIPVSLSARHNQKKPN